MNILTVKKYLPLVIIQFYLLLTIIIYNFGLVNFETRNIFLLHLLLFIYHCSIAVGFIVGVNLKFKVIHFNFNGLKCYWIFIFASVLGSLIVNKNLSGGATLFPDNLFTLLSNPFGSVSIAQIYANRMEHLAGREGGGLLNIVYFLFAWIHMAFVGYIIFYWKNFNLPKKILSIVVALMTPFFGIINGLNKPVFDFLLSFGFSYLILHYIIQEKKIRFSRLFFIGLLVFVIFFISFALIMQARGANANVLMDMSPLGGISIDCSSAYLCGSTFYATLAVLNFYLVHGYYGLSLALTETFSSTFFLGSSHFLLNNLGVLIYSSIEERTFQYKITEYWHHTAVWHTAYSQIANDFHFVGVPLFLMVVSMGFGVAWRALILHRDVIAFLVIPIYATFYIFLPANNQVFNMLAGFSAFVFLNLILFLRIKFNAK